MELAGDCSFPQERGSDVDALLLGFEIYRRQGKLVLLLQVLGKLLKLAPEAPAVRMAIVQTLHLFDQPPATVPTAMVTMLQQRELRVWGGRARGGNGFLGTVLMAGF